MNKKIFVNYILVTISMACTVAWLEYQDQGKYLFADGIFRLGVIYLSMSAVFSAACFGLVIGINWLIQRAKS
jgi:hypothetical protein